MRTYKKMNRIIHRLWRGAKVAPHILAAAREAQHHLGDLEPADLEQALSLLVANPERPLLFASEEEREAWKSAEDHMREVAEDFQERLEEARDERDDLEAERDTLKETHAKLQAEAATHAEALTSAQAELEKAKADAASQGEALTSAQAELEKAKADLKKVKADLKKATAAPKEAA